MVGVAASGGSGTPLLLYLGIVLPIMIGIAWPAAAQQATPAAAAVRATCGVAPRTVDEIIALIASLPGDPEGFATPFPPGPPPNLATMESITATVRQLEVCINTGDFLRVLALFSDDGAMFRGLPLTDDFIAEFRAMEAAPVRSAAAGSRQVLIGPWAARVLADGRVAAAVLFTFENETPFAEATKALYFVQQDGRWMIDEWTESVLIPGCELPVQMEYAVDPPPRVTVEPWPDGCMERGPEQSRKRNDRTTERKYK